MTEPTATRLGVRPLTARSAILSVLLGAHPPEAAGSSIVRWGRGVGVSEQAVRVALTRMVATGDLEREDSVYRLSERLLARQRRQDRALELRPVAWDGTWHMAVVTAVGADAARRADVRQRMLADRFGELREGVWARPANLGWQPGPDLSSSLEVFTATPDGLSAGGLSASLFDLDSWAGTARDLSTALEASDDLAERIAVAAAIVRHLVTDPLLPPELQPSDWPGPELHATYAQFRAELIALAAQ
ncbi:hypothetical protein ASD11_03930 [Aeromicrobium sp. Root495]|uniref:PaaX family transcriptional regulator C-terminal domain-containing protein n=1 Tax=Aeromicrobium sp. Root495 TaxID=1736550 RepID=UPI0006FCE1DA|nr:PaaX family transcriptional regulator C-terminal domain-containing protein [Aeromicrobium sp. Root495]KQY58792.1 hypothetical protein ASD11_03930 [Aeromicrobium sp. Root495]